LSEYILLDDEMLEFALKSIHLTKTTQIPLYWTILT
jgi:hypothetical protein